MRTPIVLGKVLLEIPVVISNSSDSKPEPILLTLPHLLTEIVVEVVYDQNSDNGNLTIASFKVSPKTLT